MAGQGGAVPGRPFPKGVSGNPAGRPKNPFIAELHAAVKKVGKEKRKPFLVHFVRQAYKDNGVATSLARKLVPDMVHTEVASDPEAPIVPMQIVFTDFPNASPLVPTKLASSSRIEEESKTESLPAPSQNGHTETETPSADQATSDGQ